MAGAVAGLILAFLSTLNPTKFRMTGQVVAIRGARFCVVAEDPGHREAGSGGRSGCYLLAYVDGVTGRVVHGDCLALSFESLLIHYPFKKADYSILERPCDVPQEDLDRITQTMLGARSEWGFDP